MHNQSDTKTWDNANKGETINFSKKNETKTIKKKVLHYMKYNIIQGIRGSIPISRTSYPARSRFNPIWTVTILQSFRSLNVMLFVYLNDFLVWQLS